MTKKKAPDLDPSEVEALDLMAGRRSACPPIGLLHAARVEALPAEIQATVSAHIEACASCRTLQADLDTLPQTSEATAQETRRILSRVRQNSGRWQIRGKDSRWPFPLWAAATAGLAVCLTLVVFISRHSSPPPTAGRPPVAARQGSPPPQVPDALKLGKPPVKMSLAVLTWRGRESNQQFLRDIAPALDLYRADRFAEAAPRFEDLAARYGDSVEIYFYLGACRLFLGEFSAASEALERAARRADDTFSSDVSWYLGLSYQRCGRLREARAQFSRLCAAPNVYRERACAAIKELRGETAAGDSGQSSPER